MTGIDIACSEIEQALNNKLYYISLVSALTLPDIMGALASENGKATPEEYIEWFNKNMPKKL